jgi:hypothetical protein
VIWLGPLDPAPDDPLRTLTDADRAWLDRMADVLPHHLVVRGSTRWLYWWVEPRILEDGIR